MKKQHSPWILPIHTHHSTTNCRGSTSFRMLLLLLALLLGIAGMWAVRSHSYAAKRSRLVLLDAQAQRFFSQARDKIPEVVSSLTSAKAMTSLCWKMARDKVFGGNRAEEHLTARLSPVTDLCREGAKVYGITLDNARFLQCMDAITSNHIAESAFAVGSLSIEAFMLKSTLRSAVRVITAAAGRMTGAVAGGGALAAMDGPLPFGDLIGLALAGIGTAWSIHDLKQSCSQASAEMTTALEEFVTDCQHACREVYLK